MTLQVYYQIYYQRREGIDFNFWKSAHKGTRFFDAQCYDKFRSGLIIKGYIRVASLVNMKRFTPDLPYCTSLLPWEILMARKEDLTPQEE